MGNNGKGDWFQEPVIHEEAANRCPECAALMAPEAVLCTACGYNLKTGQYVDLPDKNKNNTPKSRKLSASWTFLILFCAAFLLSLTVYVFYEPIMEENRSALPAGLQQKLPLSLNRPFYPKWMKDMTKDTLTAVYEKDLRTELDESHPPYRAGDTVVLRSESGKTGRGVFKGTEEQNALLEAKGQIVRVPLVTLDTDCRLRADPTGRNVYIFKTAEQRAEALLKSAE